MDAVENPVLEPRAERIARYKAERRRELVERFGNLEEIPSKRPIKDGKEAIQEENSDVPSQRASVNGRKRGVANGDTAEFNIQRRQGSQDSASMSGEGHVAPHAPSAPQLRTRVSVGQLRSALLQQDGTQPERVSGSDPGSVSSSLDLAVKPCPEGGRRRTRRCLAGSGTGRKSADRFRTQPITTNEMEDSSGHWDADEEEKNKGDVKTDARAQMSVAAKMSLFKEMEKTAAPESSSLLKPRSGSLCHERRSRRGNDHRFLTQPITCEEMVAISAPKAASPETLPDESAEDGDENCKLSVSQKLALFNKLSLPEKQANDHPDGVPERRRQKGARYRTQPITVEEVSLLQTGPVQLPSFCLAPHLSDRQQASSVNLKPSELRLSQSKPDISPASAHQGLQRYDSEPGLRGILKRARSGDSERSQADGGRTDSPVDAELNGGSYVDNGLQGKVEVSPPAPRERREDPGLLGRSLTAAPWRQRARGRRETIAYMPRDFSEQDPELEERHYKSERHMQENLLKKVDDLSDRVQIPPENNVDPQETTRSHSHKEEQRAQPQCWEPVFSNVFSSSTPQYVMCFNQTNQSFEAQEISSPDQKQIQPQWRQKSHDAEDEASQEMNGQENGNKHVFEDGQEELTINGTTNNQRRSSETLVCTNKEPSQNCEASVAAEEAKEETNGDDSNPAGRYCDESPLSTCPPPCADVTPQEGERNLDILCQTQTPVLTSAVAEHRRAVRPTRRTQGSRNPLRALAAREDIRQDYMGEQVAAEERIQAENKRKNSGSHLSRSEDTSVTSDGSLPPFCGVMLIHVKGLQQVQVRLVEPSVQSINSGDCFLLVTPENCILWSGEFSNDSERAKARELASLIQGQKALGCQASEVVQLEEGLNSDSSLASDFWTILGGRTHYRGAGAPEEDAEYERGVVESNCVYRLVEKKLVPHEQAWARSPCVSLLGSSEALVFDFGSEVYLWLGRNVSVSNRTVALQLTHQVWAGAYDYSNCRVNPLDPTQSSTSVQLSGEGRPTWALFGCISEDSETVLFREKFLDWPGRANGVKPAVPVKNETQSVPVLPPPLVPPSSDLLEACDAKALLSGQTAAEDVVVHSVLSGVDVQRGYGVVPLEEGRRAELRTASVETWHVQEFDDSEVPLESSGQLHEGDSYVIRWTYTLGDGAGGSNTAFFLWRGRHSISSGQDTATFLSIGMKAQDASQVVVPQGREPPCFLQLFKGGLVIHRGQREEPSTQAEVQAEWRMFCVRGELPEEGSLLEVRCCCASLRSRGAAVLLNSQQRALYLWLGCKAHSSTKEVAKKTVERLALLCPSELGLDPGSPPKVHTLEEGSEPADFWSAVGPMDRKSYDCMLQDPGKYNFTPRLFHLSASSGSFRAEELQSPSRLLGLLMAMPFVQEDLSSAPQPALFLLDNRLEVYLWQRSSPELSESCWQEERRCAMQTAIQYCQEMNPRRPPKAYLISSGAEPLTFTNIFPRWEWNQQPSTQSEAGQPKLTLVQDALAQLMKNPPSPQQMPPRPLPAGMDPQNQEVYVSDQDFQALLEVKKDKYV